MYIGFHLKRRASTWMHANQGVRGWESLDKVITTGQRPNSLYTFRGTEWVDFWLFRPTVNIPNSSYINSWAVDLCDG